MSTHASDNLVTVKMRTRTVVRWWSRGLAWAVLYAMAAATASPVESLIQATEETPAAPPAAESPVDVDGWVQSETLNAMFHQEADHDRRAVLQETWAWRSPTWIQNHSAVNLGDFPTLDDPTGTADRNLQTLEWALAEQRRLAAGKPAPRDEKPPTPVDDWLRRLAPQELVATLKENREWVAASGAALMAIIWGTTLFARRPARHVIVEDTPAPAASRSRRRSGHRGAGRHRSYPGEHGAAADWGGSMTRGSGRSAASGRTVTRPAPLASRSEDVDDPSMQDTEPMPLRGVTPLTGPQRG